MMRALRFAVLAATAGVLLPASAPAQTLVRSWLPWRTIETEDFAFHYPAELEEWTQYLAARIEPIDSAVTSLVGYKLPKRTHVIVDNPYAIPNGSAWPFLKKPVINFWATPPDPREDIGDFRVWGEMLAAHEFAHIVHLSRPSRNPLIRAIWAAMPIDLGPIPLKAPRWVVEGYATYVEGKVTQSGRPHGAWRAALLREWALEGQLPTYDQMNSWDAYAGGEFAYLAGSAYLEWLAARQGDSSLVYLWRRMSARQNRTFDEAFIGVYGESPRMLYGRFIADLMEKALETRRELARAGLDTGAIVQRLAWSTGDPAISADGSRVALVVRTATRPGRVVIWATTPERDTTRAKRDSILLAKDPEDVPARPIYPAPMKPLATLRSVGSSSYQQPRFMKDGRILLWRNTALGDGSLAPDLYLWNPRGRSVTRVTRAAYLRDADPSPDGRSAAAMQCRRGWCDIAIVDLVKGSVRVLADGTPVETWYRPRWAPDGKFIVASLQAGGIWRIAIIDATTGSYRLADPDDGANRYDASFISHDTLVVVSERGGIPNLERVDLVTGSVTPVTRTTGAAVAPEVNPADRSVWFLSLYSKGYDLRRIAPASLDQSVAGSLPALDPLLAPAAPPAAAQPTLFAPHPIGAPDGYSIGDRLFRWLPAPEYGADGGTGLLALVSSDVIGRSELLVQGAAGDLATWRGGSASLTWRGLHVGSGTFPLRVSGFDATQAPSANRARVPVDARLDQRLAGGTIVVEALSVREIVRNNARLGYSVARGSRLGDGTLAAARRALVFADVSESLDFRGDQSRLTVFANVNLSSGRTADRATRRQLSQLGLSLATPLLPPLSGYYQIGETRTDASVFEQFALGGVRAPLMDSGVLPQRISMPALPTGIAIGHDVHAYRVSIPGALSPYVWAGGVAETRNGHYEWHRVTGVDATISVPNIPLAGTPAARAQLGVGESIDPPLRHRVQAYVSVVFNP